MTNLELADKLQKEAEHFSGAQDLVGMLWDAGAALRNLHTENTALRVTEDNLRQELQECQDQRRAAFRRIEELDAMRAQIGQGVPIAWIRWEWNRSGRKSLVFEKPTELSLAEEATGVIYEPLYTHPAPQQIGLGVPDVDDLRVRLVAISSAIDDSDDIEAQAIIRTTLEMLASAPPAPQQKSPPAS